MDLANDSQPASAIDHYIALAIKRELLDAELAEARGLFCWAFDPLRPALQPARPVIKQTNLLGFVRVMCGLMATEHQRSLFGPDRVINGGGPEGPSRPERPEYPDKPDHPDPVPRELIDRDRANCNKVIDGIRESPLSPSDKQKAIDQVEQHHRECMANAKACLP